MHVEFDVGRIDSYKFNFCFISTFAPCYSAGFACARWAEEYSCVESKMLINWTGPKTPCIDRCVPQNGEQILQQQKTGWKIAVAYLNVDRKYWYPDDPPVPNCCDPIIRWTIITWLSMCEIEGDGKD